MPSRVCLEPGCPTLIPARKGVSRCPTHQRQQQQARDARRPTTTGRGYGAAHQALRAQLLATYQPTDPCPRCGHPLGPDPAMLDLGHTDDRFSYRGLEHRNCNRGRRREFF